jgi:Cof subfamily protein (haloacid dehalogenase superfamily)
MPVTNRFRLIALDLDGTTLDPRGKVAPRTRAAIRKLVERGVYVLFATGRNYTESKSVLEQVAHYPRCVFVGGASLVDTAPPSPQSLYACHMHPELARELCRDLHSLGETVLALEDTFTTGVDYLITRDRRVDPATQVWLQVTRSSVRYEADLDNYHHSHTLRVGIVSDQRTAPRVSQHLESKYAGRAIFHSIHVPAQGIDVVEIFDPRVSKWQGIQRVAADLGISTGEIVAVGDDVNDLPMLREAGLGVAMGNGNPLAKQAAQLTIGTNAEDGLATFLEELLKEDRIAAA